MLYWFLQKQARRLFSPFEVLSESSYSYFHTAIASQVHYISDRSTPTPEHYILASLNFLEAMPYRFRYRDKLITDAITNMLIKTMATIFHTL